MNRTQKPPVVLQTRHLTKRYGDFTAVDGIDISISQGEIFGLLGPNGAGKTTTINMLTGLARISSGSAMLARYDLAKDMKKAQRMMGVLPDESNLYEELDGFQNLCFCGSLYGMSRDIREARAKALLDEFGLADTGKKPFKAYSKGMKRKLTIAAAIIHQPEVLFLDEPTTGIDVASARQIRQMILDLNKKGTSILLTTHYIEEAERLCHRIAFLVSGKIVRTGTLDELMKEVQRDTVVQLKIENRVSGWEKAVSEEFPGLRVEPVGDGTLRIHSSNPINIAPLVTFFDRNQVSVYEAKIIRPSLEDVFVKVTGIEIAKMAQDKEKGKR